MRNVLIFRCTPNTLHLGVIYSLKGMVSRDSLIFFPVPKKLVRLSKCMVAGFLYSDVNRRRTVRKSSAEWEIARHKYMALVTRHVNSAPYRLFPNMTGGKISQMKHSKGGRIPQLSDEPLTGNSGIWARFNPENKVEIRETYRYVNQYRLVSESIKLIIVNLPYPPLSYLSVNKVFSTKIYEYSPRDYRLPYRFCDNPSLICPK